MQFSYKPLVHRIEISPTAARMLWESGNATFFVGVRGDELAFERRRIFQRVLECEEPLQFARFAAGQLRVRQSDLVYSLLLVVPSPHMTPGYRNVDWAYGV